MKSIVLMGIKHCGKSTQAFLLANKLNLPTFDTDSVIEELYKKTPREIYVQEGRDAFLQCEEKACEYIKQELEKTSKRAVIATGGGICTNQGALDILHSFGTLVFLMIDEKTACKRIIEEVVISQDGKLTNLPAYIAKYEPKTLDDVSSIFHNFYTERTELCSKEADICVQMTDSAKDINANYILQAVQNENK